MFFLKDKKVPNESDRLKQVKIEDQPLNQDKLNRAVLNPQPDTTKQTFKDISKQLQKEYQYPFVNPQASIPCHMYTLVNSSGVISFPTLVKQIVVMNQTAQTVRISDKQLATSGAVNDELVIIPANKMLVLPYFPCRAIYYLITTYTPASKMPTLWGYGEAIFSPNMCALT